MSSWLKGERHAEAAQMIRDEEQAALCRAGPERVRPMAICLSCGIVLLAGCAPFDARTAIGDPQAGAVEIARNSCGSCHEIPGIEGSNGRVGPSLAGFSRRQTIAGVLPNTPSALQRYLGDPQSTGATNVMPDEGLNDKQVRDIAAYIYTLD
jgi:cytochrome c2